MSKKFDNPYGTTTRRMTLSKYLLRIMLLPALAVFGGLNASANPILADSGSTGGQASGSPAPQGTEAGNNPNPAPGQQGPAPAQEIPSGQSPAPVVPGTGQQPGGPAAPGQQPGAQPPAPAPAPVQAPTGVEILHKMGLNKFQDIEGFAKSYQSMEQMFGRLTNENTQLKTKLDNVVVGQQPNSGNQVQPGQSQQTPPQQPPQQPPQKTPEEIEAENIKLADELINNPLAVIERIRKETAEATKKEVLSEVDKRYGPIEQDYAATRTQNTWNQKAKEFTQAKDAQGQLIHPEIAKPEIQESMAKAFDLIPGLEDRPDALEIAYKMAVGEHATSTGNAPAIDPNTLLADEQFLQLAANNPKIMEIATQKYLAGIKGGQPPAVITSTTGGALPAQPENKPKTINEGSNALRRAWGLVTGH